MSGASGSCFATQFPPAAIQMTAPALAFAQQLDTHHHPTLYPSSPRTAYSHFLAIDAVDDRLLNQNGVAVALSNRPIVVRIPAPISSVSLLLPPNQPNVC